MVKTPGGSSAQSTLPPNTTWVSPVVRTRVCAGIPSLNPINRDYREGVWLSAVSNRLGFIPGDHTVDSQHVAAG